MPQTKYLFFILSLLIASGTFAQSRKSMSLEVLLTTLPYYSDADGDGYGDPAIVTYSSTGAPAGFVANNTDCDPSTPAKYRLGNFYVDADNDTFYDGNPQRTSVCYGISTPLGYTPTLIGSDCDDTRFEVNSNHVEVLANGIDDNCDGNIDEIGPYTTLMPAFCGNVLQFVGSTIYATPLPGATGYRFQVTLGSVVTTFDSNTNSFNLTDLPVAPNYLTTYTVKISVRTNGFWRAYAPSCTVATPRAPIVTTILTQQCGLLMNNMANTVYCYQNLSATLYRFELSDGINPPRLFDSINNRFDMQSFTGGGEFATTYTVRVALKIAGVWEDFGPSCSLTTPPLPPESWIISAQCGITISNSWTTIYTGAVTEAEGYRFRVTNGSSIRFFDTPNNRFSLHNLNGALPAPNTVYTISVAILYHGAYLAFGASCTVTTASVLIMRHAAPESEVYEVKSYPNPFADTFKLEINTSGEEKVLVKVYDMIGKLVESREVNASESDATEIGSQYPSGVYNVIVSQAENVKTLRVIKR